MVKTPDIDTVWQWLDQVPDPEIPVISLVDLGIVRDVAYQGDKLRITLSPTYSGCPATRVIEEDVRTAMRDHGIEQVDHQSANFSPLDHRLDVRQGQGEITRLWHRPTQCQGTARGLPHLRCRGG